MFYCENANFSHRHTHKKKPCEGHEKRQSKKGSAAVCHSTDIALQQIFAAKVNWELHARENLKSTTAIFCCCCVWKATWKRFFFSFTAEGKIALVVKWETRVTFIGMLVVMFQINSDLCGILRDERSWRVIESEERNFVQLKCYVGGVFWSIIF